MLKWIEENRNSIRTPEDLAKHFNMSGKEIKQMKQVCDTFRVKITPYYLNLINKDDPNDPLRLMAVPSIKELRVKKGELDDPIGDVNEELDNQPVQAITHRYPDRVLFYPTPRCGGYCRHCFRRRLAGKQEFHLTEKQVDTALEYIQSHEEIHEVIFTGGDPLMVGDNRLDDILEFIHNIPHIWTIRIHTRMPVWNPYRITDDLVNILKKYQPMWIVTHFNHPRELSDIAVENISKLIDNGIMVLNQSVFLKGVNDSYETQKELVWALIKARIKPYYLHHLDKAKGISHFRAGIKKGMKILRELRGTVPGYAIPHYILDIPGGYGKIPMQYHYLSSDGNGTIIVETPFGDLKSYVDNVENEPRKLEEMDEIKPIALYPQEIIKILEGVIEDE